MAVCFVYRFVMSCAVLREARASGGCRLAPQGIMCSADFPASEVIRSQLVQVQSVTKTLLRSAAEYLEVDDLVLQQW